MAGTLVFFCAKMAAGHGDRGDRLGAQLVRQLAELLRFQLSQV